MHFVIEPVWMLLVNITKDDLLSWYGAVNNLRDNLSALLERNSSDIRRKIMKYSDAESSRKDSLMPILNKQ